MANTTEEFHWPVNTTFEEEVQWSTLVTKYESGKEQRRKKWSQPKRIYSVNIKGRSKEVSTQIWDFYNSRSGAFDTFYFTNPNEVPVSSERFGTGNGVSTLFSLAHSPLPSGSITVTSEGVPKTEITDYTINRATGAITFNSAPASGDALVSTYDYARVVRFAESNLSRELFNYQLYNIGVKLAQVL